MICLLKNSLLLKDQENMVEYTRTQTKIQLIKLNDFQWVIRLLSTLFVIKYLIFEFDLNDEMEKLQCRQSEDDDQSFNAFTTVMRKDHQGV